MISHDFEKSILALVCWNESHQESLDAMLAIGHCLMNRARESSLPLLEVFAQFQHGAYPDSRDPRFTALLNGIDRVYEGAKDPTDGCLNWSRPIHGEAAKPPRFKCGSFYFWQ